LVKSLPANPPMITPFLLFGESVSPSWVEGSMLTFETFRPTLAPNVGPCANALAGMRVTAATNAAVRNRGIWRAVITLLRKVCLSPFQVGSSVQQEWCLVKIARQSMTVRGRAAQPSRFWAAELAHLGLPALSLDRGHFCLQLFEPVEDDAVLGRWRTGLRPDGDEERVV